MGTQQEMRRSGSVAVALLLLLLAPPADSLRVYVSVPFETAQSNAVIQSLTKAGMIVEAGVHNNDESKEKVFLRDVVAANRLDGTYLVATPVHQQNSKVNFDPIIAPGVNIPIFWLGTSVVDLPGKAKISAD